MTEQEFVSSLLATASMSIALLGFAAIVSIFHPLGPDGQRWKPDGRFWSMVSCSLGTTFLAMFPLPFLSASILSAKVWLLCSIAQSFLGLVLIALSVKFYPKNLESGKNPHLGLFLLLIAMFVVVIALGVGNLGMFGESVFWPFYSSIVILLLSTSWLFVRLLYVWLL